MKRSIITMLLLASLFAPTKAQEKKSTLIDITSSMYLDKYKGQMGDTAKLPIMVSADAEEIEIPDVPSVGCFQNLGFKRLRKVTFNSTDLLPEGLFDNMPDLEEVVVNGTVGHVDFPMARNCHKLRSVVFNGPVGYANGSAFAYNCPELEKVVFNSVVPYFGLKIYDTSEFDLLCPKLKMFSGPRYYIDAEFEKEGVTPLNKIVKNKKLRKEITDLVDWEIKTMMAENSTFMRSYGYDWAKTILPYLKEGKLTKEYESLKNAYDCLSQLDEFKDKIQLLKESTPYNDEPIDLAFSYESPNDSLLALDREYYNLDSIAGNGDDISKIKNLLYWVHDLVEHNGSSPWPDCDFNIRDLESLCKKEDRGLNCRFMAFMLTEALLAEGIPARYLTCQSKCYDTDFDCHVICVAWSESLNKWVWVDPTFAAYVTDENGVMLHPGEVRYRLQNDLPLVLNEDANWNHKNKQTKEYYLETYMAKNLYLIEANLNNGAQPEGKTAARKSQFVMLRPDGFNVNNKYTKIFTSNYDAFWAAPK